MAKLDPVEIPIQETQLRLTKRDINQTTVFQQGIESLGGVPIVVTHDPDKGFKIASFEHLGERPALRRCDRAFGDIESFGRYFRDQAESCPEGNVARVYIDEFTVVAVFDGHGVKPGWEKDRAVIGIDRGEEYHQWLEISGTTVSEEDFPLNVDFLADSIVEPNAAELAQTLRSLEVQAEQARGAETTADRQESTATMRTQLKTKIPNLIQVQCRAFEDYEVKFGVSVIPVVTNAMGVSFRLKIVKRFELEKMVSEELSNRVEEACGVKPFLGSGATETGPQSVVLEG